MENKTVINYYYAPISAYSYLGEPRLVEIGRASGATIAFKPLDIMPVFAAAQITPPARQSAARLAYRQQDLARTAKRLAMPLRIKPAHWPVPMALAARVIIAAGLAGEDQHLVSMAIMTAIQARELNIADPQTLLSLLTESALPANAIMTIAQSVQAEQLLLSNINEAISLGVMGAPCYVIDDQLFFGQDRLVDLEWWLAEEVSFRRRRFAAS